MDWANDKMPPDWLQSTAGAMEGMTEENREKLIQYQIRPSGTEQETPLWESSI